ncbi:Lrp/AsnC family transcriptional regulator [Mycetocola miduiensis]|uniref:Transcriptional regulator, AsnC family n=1 Tax=Mycetocola miduiensis TaxID=995034 RepID=A0A1I5BLC2_9MICO|nr:Lrp/AsnC family transcriptional regulator [Mycetocola miduiensis]SFN75452.1 transcriptional regulator, AsnC family [Mycetocola miduiensis]
MEPKKPQLDSTDRALLRALSANARASGSQLATDLGLAESTVSLRLRRLHQSGHITGYHADIDLAVLGAPLQALIAVQLAQHNRADIQKFRREAPTWPGVLSMFHMGGRDDYLMHVAARSTADLREFVVQYLTGHPAVAHTETNLVFEHAAGTGWQQLLA